MPRKDNSRGGSPLSPTAQGCSIGPGKAGPSEGNRATLVPGRHGRRREARRCGTRAGTGTGTRTRADTRSGKSGKAGPRRNGGRPGDPPTQAPVTPLSTTIPSGFSGAMSNRAVTRIAI